MVTVNGMVPSVIRLFIMSAVPKVIASNAKIITGIKIQRFHVLPVNWNDLRAVTCFTKAMIQQDSMVLINRSPSEKSIYPEL